MLQRYKSLPGSRTGHILQLISENNRRKIMRCPISERLWIPLLMGLLDSHLTMANKLEDFHGPALPLAGFPFEEVYENDPNYRNSDEFFLPPPPLDDHSYEIVPNHLNQSHIEHIPQSEPAAPGPANYPDFVHFEYDYDEPWDTQYEDGMHILIEFPKPTTIPSTTTPAPTTTTTASTTTTIASTTTTSELPIYEDIDLGEPDEPILFPPTRFPNTRLPLSAPPPNPRPFLPPPQFQGLPYGIPSLSAIPVGQIHYNQHYQPQEHPPRGPQIDRSYLPPPPHKIKPRPKPTKRPQLPSFGSLFHPLKPRPALSYLPPSSRSKTTQVKDGHFGWIENQLGPVRRVKGGDGAVELRHPYQYAYKVLDDSSGINFGAKEASNGIDTYGQYHVVLPDGRLQTVSYTANDDTGYKATVKYSRP